MSSDYQEVTTSNKHISNDFNEQIPHSKKIRTSSKESKKETNQIQ